MDVQKISVTVPMNDRMAADIASMQCMMWLSLAIDMDPLSLEESESGWRTKTHGDHEHTYAVGWRAEQMKTESDAKIAAEKAACPYVACECGWHED